MERSCSDGLGQELLSFLVPCRVTTAGPWMCLGVRVYSLSLFVTCANLESKLFVLDPTQMLDGRSLGEEPNVQPQPVVPLTDAKREPPDNNLLLLWFHIVS